MTRVAKREFRKYDAQDALTSRPPLEQPSTHTADKLFQHLQVDASADPATKEARTVAQLIARASGCVPVLWLAKFVA